MTEGRRRPVRWINGDSTLCVFGVVTFGLVFWKI